MNPIYKPAGLVYSSRDETGFIPNGYDINSKGGQWTYFDSYNYFFTHLNDPYDNEYEKRKINIQKFDLDSFNEKITNFFIISHASIDYEFISSDEFVLPKKLIDKLKTKKIYLVFLQEHEPCTEIGFVNLCNKLDKLEIPLHKVILINNNSKLYDYKEKYNFDVIVHHSKFLYFSFTKTLKLLDTQWIDEKKGKFFMSRNRNPKSHRISFLIHLFMENLIENFNYSFIPNEGYRLDDFNYLYGKFFDKSFIENNIDIFNFMSNHKKEDDFEIGKNWVNLQSGEFTHHNDFSFLYHIPELPKSFENSYVNVVTESSYESNNNSVHITEKSLRPFYFYQFPIFISSPHHIKYLKEHYNFDFFDDIIDHSYDKELDDRKRMKMVIDEIHRINNNKELFINFYKNNKERFQNNREKCLRIGFESKKHDLDFFWNLL
jgi:hypothetical protein